MQGWKTWSAAFLSVFYGAGGFLLGIHSGDTAMQFVVAGLGLVGLGHKLDRIRNGT